MRFELSRWYYSEGQRIHPAARIGVISAIARAFDLEAVEREMEYLRNLPKRWPHVLISTPLPRWVKDVLALMRDGRSNLYHFAAHGVLPPSEASVPGIQIGSDYMRVDRIIGEVAEGLRRSMPVIFMNACHSSRQGLALTRADGWVQRFLEFGCAAFIGANWEVNDRLAADFAIEVYEQLRSGHTIASAVQKARILVRDKQPGNSTWLAYSLYSHPNLQVHAE
jgi:CHAT domain-containing protein